MADAGETPVPREGTMRRTAAALGNDKLHKGINWLSIAGVITTAVLGYLADARNGEKREQIASGAATEIAVLQAWKDDAEADLKSQAEQIVKLREAVAALKAAGDMVAQGYGARPLGARLRAATEDVQEILDGAPAPAPERALEHAADRDRAQEDRVQGIKKKLLNAPE